MKLWKCYNCVPTTGPAGVDFEAHEPICPRCGVDGTTPDGAQTIAPRATIHFDPPHPTIARKATNLAACDGKSVMGRMGSGVPSAVTCPDCKQTSIYKSMVNPDGSESVSGTINQAGGTNSFVVGAG